jgi:hypothetical protein
MRTRIWLVVAGVGFLGLLAALGDFVVLDSLIVVIIVAGFILLVTRGPPAAQRTFPQEKTYGGVVKTERGEVVRSNSEKRIADYFYRNKIGYAYELEAVSRAGRRRRISRPDFYLTDYGVYVEFWGLVDAEDPKLRANYERTMRWKMAQYHRNGIKFISLYPSDLSNLDGAFRYKLQKVSGRIQATSIPRFCYKCGVPTTPSESYCGSCGVKL